MRRAVPIIALAAAFLFLGRTERRLRKELGAIVPPSFELVDCEFAHGLFGLVSPPAYYCVYVAAGTRDTAVEVLRAALANRAYDVAHAPYVDAIELRGRRSGFEVKARVGWRGVGPHLVPRPIPEGYVAASVTVGAESS
jgi:hypothetical protein